jgi:dTDP-4-dehydrorhamnose 3,5-epimerase
MIFTPLDIPGAYGISSPSKSDFRGTLIRTWESNPSLQEFDLVQSSITINPKSGTLRGMHFQRDPYAENKIVLCITGRVFDVVLDLRKESPTFSKHLSFEIGQTAKYLGILIPPGCAHGYLTLVENSILLYYMDAEFSPDHATGVLWDDPKYGIRWPQQPSYLSELDSKWPVADL